MSNHGEILENAELKELTAAFQRTSYSKSRALELSYAAIVAMITEPGDQMAGAIATSIGKAEFVALLLEGLGTRQLFAALDRHGQLERFRSEFENVESLLIDSRQRWLPRLSKSRLQHLFDNSKKLGLRLITPEDSNWPKGLGDLQYSCPFMLFIEGNEKALSNLDRAVSIVGSRAASSYGKQVTTELVRELASAGRQTVSGGALGIDAQTHLSSIEWDTPTIAVMAGGLDRKYPKANFQLFDRIKFRGLVISELPPGVAPTRWRFLQRNRLIAALTPMTVVVEAGVRSGSIRTANNALELGRHLFAIPGSVLSNTSAGTNSLISENKAILLWNFQEFATGVSSISIRQDESDIAKRALDAIRELGFPTRAEIAKVAGLTASELKLALRELASLNLILEQSSKSGDLHYALRHGY